MRLTYADVCRCDAVTDVGLEALCKGCPLVEELDLSWLTELSHLALLASLPTLTHMQAPSLSLSLSLSLSVSRSLFPSVYSLYIYIYACIYVLSRSLALCV
jgi:hypothetical protein